VCTLQSLCCGESGVLGVIFVLVLYKGLQAVRLHNELVLYKGLCWCCSRPCKQCGVKQDACPLDVSTGRGELI
jgi:hypothetical protein